MNKIKWILSENKNAAVVVVTVYTSKTGVEHTYVDHIADKLEMKRENSCFQSLLKLIHKYRGVYSTNDIVEYDFRR